MMAAMAINSKKIFSRTGCPMILKLGMKHQGIELYNVYSDAPASLLW